MHLKKQGYPQEDELVMCTITNIQFHSVFASLDEYSKSGMIHISEVSPGRIRNIREFVEEGKKVVCKVLRVNEAKGYIDLSLRRVNEAQKRAKLNEIKKEQLAENIIEYVAKKHKEAPEALYKKIADKLVPKYGGVYGAFEQVAFGTHKLTEDGLEAALSEELTGIIKQRIKPPEVTIKGALKLSSYEPNGLEIVRDALLENKIGTVDVVYLGGGSFSVSVTSKDYKTAESILDKYIGGVTEYMKKNKSVAVWARAE